jgi:hypothetical protein
MWQMHHADNQAESRIHFNNQITSDTSCVTGLETRFTEHLQLVTADNNVSLRTYIV